MLCTKVGDGIKFPPMLKAFENRDYIVTLLIEEKNIKKSCSVYTVYALDEPVEMLGNHNPGDTVDITSNADSVTMVIIITVFSVKEVIIYVAFSITA